MNNEKLTLNNCGYIRNYELYLCKRFCVKELGERMTKLVDFFKNIKWWEYLYLSIYFVVAITLGIVFKSGYIIILNSLLCIVGFFFIAKGIAIGNVFGIVSLVFYCANSFFNKFYGEIIYSVIFTFPAYVVSLYTWISTRKRGSKVVSVNRTFSALEWILTLLVSGAVSVGIYYLLQAFDTSNLVVSTISTALGMLAGYLMARRCEFSFLFFIVGDVICAVLWISSLQGGNFSTLPTVMQYVILFFINCFGLFNWIRLKRAQNKDGDNVERMLEICKTDVN